MLSFLDTKSIEPIIFCQQNGIIIIILTPHTTHKLQPLDLSYFKPLKAAYNESCCRWLKMHPSRKITEYQVSELFNDAYSRVSNVSNLTNGFRAYRIFPFDRDLIIDSNFP